MTDILALAPDARSLLFTEARTANTFTDEPVSDHQVQAIYDLVKYGPTALNSQPLRILLVREEGRDRLLKHIADGNRDKTASAPLVAVLAADPDFHEHLDETFPHVPGMRDRFPDPAQRAEMARFNAALQAGYFLIGVRAAGLAAGPMGGFDATGLDEDLLAGTGWKSFLVVNIGHPGENAWYPRLPRLAYEQVVQPASDAA